MPTIKLTPGSPLEVALTFHSPHVVAYRLWYKQPGDSKYTIFATGTDEKPSNPSMHTYVVPSLPAGSEIVYLVRLSGNASTAYRFDITLSQNGQPVADAAVVLQGITDVDGFAQEKDTFHIS